MPTPFNWNLFHFFFFHSKALADDSPYAANYTVDQIISHPQYDPNTGVNDIAVILVKPNIRFSRGVNVSFSLDDF